jgi:hypothetical protein
VFYGFTVRSVGAPFFLLAEKPTSKDRSLRQLLQGVDTGCDVGAVECNEAAIF